MVNENPLTVQQSVLGVFICEHDVERLSCVSILTSLEIYHTFIILSTFYKSSPLEAITFLYQKKESLREREKSPVPSSWRFT